MSNMKNKRQYLTKESVSSKYRVEPESKKSNINGVLNGLSIERNIVQNVTPLF